MSNLKLNSTGGGSVTLVAPNTASNLTVTLPNSNVTLGDSVAAQNCSYTGTLVETGGNIIFRQGFLAGGFTMDMGSNRVMTGVRTNMSNDVCGFQFLQFWVRGYNIKNTAV